MLRQLTLSINFNPKNMKKITVLLLLLTLSQIKAQTTRYIYETYVNPDTVNLVSIKPERTFLDVKKDRSLFISENKLKKDSLSANMPEDEKNTGKNKKGKNPKEPLSGFTAFDCYIVKNIPSQEILYAEDVWHKTLYYPEDRKINWIISNETSSISGYPAQKATTSFGGRNWTAWFTKEIPVSDGPYKFNGLPGLIIRLEDSRGDFRFELARKITVQNPFEKTITSDAKKVSRTDFRGEKAAAKLANAKELRKLSTDSGPSEMRGQGGPPHGQDGPGGRNDMPDGEFPPTGNRGMSSGTFPSQNQSNPIELK